MSLSCRTTMKCKQLWFSMLILLLASSAQVATPVDRRALAQTPAKCSQYAPLYHTIDQDLQRWQATGISRRLMMSTIRDHASLSKRPHSQKGFAAAFINGTAVLLREPELSWPGHHVAIWIVYMRVLLQLQRDYGSGIPDVEFVISTVDRPLKLSTNATDQQDQPVFRFCKTDAHPDILIPCFHFHVKGMIHYLLRQKRWLSSTYPWSSKEQVLFGRFSPYNRHLHANDPYAQRLGAGGKEICHRAKPSGGTGLSCPVRQHFVEWTQSQKSAHYDVDMEGRLPMKHHAKYRYLAHLDGQGLSSRLEQLLTLGSVVFKEESGYRGFYHSLLRPYIHYVPFWRKGPEEAAEGMQWVLQNDEKAQAIATASQEFAHQFFNQEALSCYWLTLLTRFAQLQNYLAESQTPPSFYMTVSDYVKTVAKTHDGGKWYEAYALADYETE